MNNSIKIRIIRDTNNSLSVYDGIDNLEEVVSISSVDIYRK